MLPLIPLALSALPSIIDLITGGKADAVGQVVSTVAKEVLGTDDPVRVEAALKNDPAAAEAFKARLASEVEKIRAETERLRVENEEMANARAMQISLAPDGGIPAYMPAIQSVVNWLFAGGVVVAVAMGWLREDGIVVGFGIGVYTASNNFWLGSSSGSKRSGDAVRALAQASVAPSVGQIAGQAIDAVAKTARRPAKA